MSSSPGIRRQHLASHASGALHLLALLLGPIVPLAAGITFALILDVDAIVRVLIIVTTVGVTILLVVRQFLSTVCEIGATRLRFGRFGSVTEIPFSSIVEITVLKRGSAGKPSQRSVRILHESGGEVETVDLHPAHPEDFAATLAAKCPRLTATTAGRQVRTKAFSKAVDALGLDDH